MKKSSFKMRLWLRVKQGESLESFRCKCIANINKKEEKHANFIEFICFQSVSHASDSGFIIAFWISFTEKEFSDVFKERWKQFAAF